MLRVVLADDEKKVLLLMRKLIDWEGLGFEIVGMASDGISALDQVREKKPHLLVTDIRMPGCDGIDLVRQAKQIQPGLHFIIVSGYRQFEYAQNALKYGVEGYLLKPLKQEEMVDLLISLKEKMGEEAAIEYRLKKSSEREQERIIDTLMTEVRGGVRTSSTVRSFDLERGLPEGGSYFAAVIRPHIPSAAENQDGFRAMQKHALEIVRQELGQMDCGFVASARREGIVAAVYTPEYQPVEVKRCFTKIRKEIEKQRDLFWGIRAAVCLGSRQSTAEKLSVSLKEALWLCIDGLCHTPNWRDAEAETPDFSLHYTLDSAQKRRFQEAAECLNTEQYAEELEDSYRAVMSMQPLWGQMLEDWFRQILTAVRYGLQQDGSADEQFYQRMEDGLWQCTNAQELLRLLQDGVSGELNRLHRERSQREARPITDAKRFIRQHYQESLRLEDVSNAVGFNATYFSAMFKKETGQNFMDYLTELRMNKAKELLCGDECSVQDVAEQVGYRDLKYFSRLFKKTTGISPSDYKKLYR